MKEKQLKKYLVIGLLAALLVPAQAIFAKNAPTVALGQTTEKQSFSAQLVKVTTASAAQAIKLAPASAVPLAFSSCSAATSGSSFQNIQNTGSVNLNQPASCFSLRLGFVPAAPVLSVRPLEQQIQTVVVTTVAVVLHSFSFFPAKDSQKTNVTLVVVFAVFAELLVENRRKIAKVKSLAFQKFIFQPSLAQLVMLRC